MSEAIRNGYKLVALLDVESGNLNGDSDAGNIPRINPESGYGLVTDVCLKRKIRSYVELAKEEEEGYQIYIEESVPLDRSDNKAFEYLHIDETKRKDLKENDSEADRRIRDFMRKDFFDIRTFDAVMITFVKASLNCGQVRGPVQLGFARSIDPIVSQEVTITRVAITTKKDAESKSMEMGGKNIVSCGLYKIEGHTPANLARKTIGFSEEGLELLWEAVINMFEHDHSVARGEVAVQEPIVFKHNKELGDCPTYKLFEAVEVMRKGGILYSRKYQDYEVTVHKE